MSKQTWVTSDWHLGHGNILKFDKRDFENIEKHDTHIINTFNHYVGAEDDVYFLGDFALTRRDKIEYYMSLLQGNLYFIKGNHDKKDTINLYEKYGTYLGEQKKVRIDGTDVILNHFAMRVWDKSHHGTIHLYGHSHDSMEAFPWGKSMDIGIMSAYRILGEYRPFNFWDNVVPIMNKRDIKFTDHHNSER